MGISWDELFQVLEGQQSALQKVLSTKGGLAADDAGPKGGK